MKVFAALDNDISAGTVWLSKPGLPVRSVVKITNPDAGKSVYCEALQFEENFLTRYNNDANGRRYRIDKPETAISMGYWYRARLGDLQTQQECSLQIVKADRWWAKLRACFDHPQIVVRVAARLGVLSVALGLIGVALGAWSIWLALTNA